MECDDQKFQKSLKRKYERQYYKYLKNINVTNGNGIDGGVVTVEETEESVPLENEVTMLCEDEAVSFEECYELAEDVYRGEFGNLTQILQQTVRLYMRLPLPA